VKPLLQQKCKFTGPLILPAN